MTESGRGVKKRKQEPPPRPLRPGERCTRFHTHPKGEHHHARWRQKSAAARCTYVEPVAPKRTWCRGLVLVAPLTDLTAVGGLPMSRFLAPYNGKHVKLILEVD